MSLLDNYLYLDNYLLDEMGPLRKCQYCGLEAHNEIDLEKFTKAKKYKHGRRNICKPCFAGLLRKGGRYNEGHIKASKNWLEKNRDRRADSLKRRVTMKEDNGTFKRIFVDENPRTGTCSECGSTGKTHIHHDQYDPDIPLANTRELCNSCHTKYHNAERKTLREAKQ